MAGKRVTKYDVVVDMKEATSDHPASAYLRKCVESGAQVNQKRVLALCKAQSTIANSVANTNVTNMFRATAAGRFARLCFGPAGGLSILALSLVSKLEDIKNFVVDKIKDGSIVFSIICDDLSPLEEDLDAPSVLSYEGHYYLITVKVLYIIYSN